MKIGQITQLENLLMAWENHCLMAECGYAQALFEKGHPLGHEFFHNAPDFREYLSHSLGKPFDRKFLPEEIMHESNWTWYMLPIFFHAWVNNSKRVYHLSKALANMFLVTSLKKVNCEDIHFPFGSFVLTLDSPLTDAQGRSFDCLVFADNIDLYGEENMGIILLDTMWKSVKVIDQEATEKIRWAIRKKRWDKIKKKIEQHNAYTKANPVSIVRYYIAKQKWSGEITDFVRQYRGALREDNQDDELWLKVFHILMGLCFFFQNLPNSVIKEQIRPICRPVAKIEKSETARIFASSQIFSFAWENILSQEENEIFGRINVEHLAGIEISPHFRCGHWRRPPGFGQDPSHPKTVWVRPCIINADKLKEGELPEGNMTELK